MQGAIVARGAKSGDIICRKARVWASPGGCGRGAETPRDRPAE